jgi:hypothetical protein
MMDDIEDSAPVETTSPSKASEHRSGSRSKNSKVADPLVPVGDGFFKLIRWLKESDLRLTASLLEISSSTFDDWINKRARRVKCSSLKQLCYLLKASPAKLAQVGAIRDELRTPLWSFIGRLNPTDKASFLKKVGDTDCTFEQTGEGLLWEYFCAQVTMTPNRASNTHSAIPAAFVDAPTLASRTEIQSGQLVTAASRPLGENTGSESFDPLDAFKNFDGALQRLKAESSRDIIDQEAVADTALHCIQAAYYLKNLPWLEYHVTQIGKKLAADKISPALANAQAVVLGACGVYQALGLKQGADLFKDRWTELNDVTPDEKYGELNSWTDAIRLDFLGLCDLHLYLHSIKNDDKTAAVRHCSDAITEFTYSLAQFDKIRSTSRQIVVSLWKGYVHRNLGRAHAAMKAKDDALTNFKDALDHRRRVFNSLKGDLHPEVMKYLKDHLSIEVAIVAIDVAAAKGDREMFKQLANKLLERRGVHSLGMWSHISEVLCTYSLQLQKYEIAEQVIEKSLMEPLSHMVGSSSAALILGRIQSSGIIQKTLAEQRPQTTTDLNSDNP